MTTLSVPLILVCGHVMPGTPNGKAVHCLICKVESPVKDVHILEWHAKCVTCNYGRWTGISQELARRRAANHQRETVFHKVNVLYEVNPECEKAQKFLRENGFIV